MAIHFGSAEMLVDASALPECFFRMRDLRKRPALKESGRFSGDGWKVNDLAA
jgi:hypothetical protein